MTHYEVLGVPRGATTAQIRTAFRRLARANHPDTSGSGSVEALAAVNEAWRVLGDPQLRHDYDRSLDVPSASAPSGAGDPVLVPVVPPSSFPWRFLAGMAVVGIGVVLLGVFTYKPSKPAPPDNVLQPGSCVVIQDNGDAAEVNCENDHDGVVDTFLTTGDLCPASLEPHRDQQGLGIACIRFDV